MRLALIYPYTAWKKTYGTVDDMLIPSIIVDVYRYAAQSGYLGGEFVEARIVLLLALVGLRHGGEGLLRPFVRDVVVAWTGCEARVHWVGWVERRLKAGRRVWSLGCRCRAWFG